MKQVKGFVISKRDISNHQHNLKHANDNLTIGRSTKSYYKLGSKELDAFLDNFFKLSVF